MRPRTKDTHLPTCVYLNKGVYYFVKKNMWHPLGATFDESRFQELKDRFDNQDIFELEKHIRSRLYQQKQEAKKSGREFSITPANVISIAAHQRWCCALTGVPFSLKKRAGIRIRPYAPSVDRIDNAIGYVEGNVRVVLASVNIARNVMDDSLLIDLAKSITKSHK